MEQLYQLKESVKTDEVKLKMPMLCSVQKPLSWWSYVCDEDQIEIVPNEDKPIIIDSPNLNNLKQQCQQYIDFVFSDKYHEDNDYETYIAESAIETLFGDDIYDKINKRTK